MDKQKIQIIITSILVVILIIVVFINFKPKPRKKPVVKPKPVDKINIPLPPPGAKKSSPPSATATPEELETQRKRAKMEWGLDPFYHAISKEIRMGSGLKLKGISFGGGKGYAFIDNEIVTVGDVIAGYEVKEIQKNKVLLKRGDENFYLLLPED